MKKIDRNNYETFFIDYLDGNLPFDEIDLLLDFLNENPDLACELKNLENIKLQPPALPDFSFHNLKKSDFDLPEIFEETCIRAIENDLNETDNQTFQEYLKLSEEHQKTFGLFRSTISEPDLFIVYDRKDYLKKNGKAIAFRYWYAVAAMLILGLMFFLPSERKTRIQPIVQVVKPVEKMGGIPAESASEKNVFASSEIRKENRPNTVAPSVEKHSFITEIKTTGEEKTEETKVREVIEPMKPLLADVQIGEGPGQDIKLATIETREVKPKKNYSEYLTIKEFIAQKFGGQENNNSIEKVALNTLKKVSGEKFDYTTTSKGKINKFEFNSQLIAFSIPVNSKN